MTPSFAPPDWHGDRRKAIRALLNRAGEIPEKGADAPATKAFLAGTVG